MTDVLIRRNLPVTLSGGLRRCIAAGKRLGFDGTLQHFVQLSSIQEQQKARRKILCHESTRLFLQGFVDNFVAWIDKHG